MESYDYPIEEFLESEVAEPILCAECDIQEAMKHVKSARNSISEFQDYIKHICRENDIDYSRNVMYNIFNDLWYRIDDVLYCAEISEERIHKALNETYDLMK